MRKSYTYYDRRRITKFLWWPKTLPFADNREDAKGHIIYETRWLIQSTIEQLVNHNGLFPSTYQDMGWIDDQSTVGHEPLVDES